MRLGYHPLGLFLPPRLIISLENKTLELDYWGEAWGGVVEPRLGGPGPGLGLSPETDPAHGVLEVVGSVVGLDSGPAGHQLGYMTS